ncbi:hypothetical protein CDEF62S_02675 [Castellaniella defragrans]
MRPYSRQPLYRRISVAEYIFQRGGVHEVQRPQFELLRGAAADPLSRFVGGLAETTLDLAQQQLHLARIRARVKRGGHDIPEQKVRERWFSSRANLIGLMPALAHLRVYDNSAEAVDGRLGQEPALVLEMADARRLHPRTLRQAAETPEWAKPIVEAAFELDND